MKLNHETASHAHKFNETTDSFKKRRVAPHDNTGFMSGMSVNLVKPEELRIRDRATYMNIKNDQSRKFFHI